MNFFAAMSTARLERVFCCMAVMVASGLSIAYRHAMNPDAIAYLELGEEWWRGNIAHAIHGYWNPIFPILMAGAAKFAPSRYWEATAMHAANALTYLLVVWAFRKLLRELTHCVDQSEESWRRILLYGYPLFFWASFLLIRFQYLTPDILVFFWVLLASRCLLRISRNVDVGKNSILLGLILGCGYLTKTVMFLLGWVYLGCLAVTLLRNRTNVLWAAACCGVFAAVAAPNIVLLSRAHGHLTYGESGAMAYAWKVNGMSLYEPVPAWDENRAAPVVRILDHPPTYKYTTDRNVTYPLGYEPDYLHARKPKFELGDQVRTLKESARFFLDLLLFTPVPVIVLFSLVLLRGVSNGFARDAMVKTWPILIPCAAALSLYSLVYIETRYLAPFLMIGLLSGVLWLDPSFKGEVLQTDRLPGTMGGVIMVIVLVSVSLPAAKELISPRPHSYAVHNRVARVLRSQGVQAGSKIAVAGAGSFAYFARLADVQIAVETPTVEAEEWHPTTHNLQKIIDTLRERTACEILVFEKLSPGFWVSGAIDVKSTPYAIYRLQKASGVE